MMKKATMEAFSSVCVTRSKRVTTTPITTEKEKKEEKQRKECVGYALAPPHPMRTRYSATRQKLSEWDPAN
jgi:hypothetical protein